MKKLIVLLILMFACAGGDEQEDLGQLEQGLTFRSLGGWRNDLSTGSKGVACANPITGPATQQCVFPNSKTVTYQCASGFDAAQLAECKGLLDTEVSALNAQFSANGWSFSRVNSGGLVQISNAVLSAPASQTSILPYIAPGGSISSAMGEPNGTNPAGSYHVYFNMQVLVDWAKVNSNFNTAARRARVRAQTVSAVAAMGAGLGLQSFDFTRRNAIVITPDADKVVNYHSTDQCRVNGYSPLPANIVEFAGGC